jgi:hypothetical protein
LVNDAFLDAERGEARQRAFVVAGRKIVPRLHALDRVAVLVHVEDAEPDREEYSALTRFSHGSWKVWALSV